MKNRTYVIHEPPDPRNGLLGGVSSPLPVLVANGDWEPFLPEYEAQNRFGMESMNCVQFSRLNVIEATARIYGIDLNLSDRFLAWASGCTRQGNSFSACDQLLKARGCCSEGRWPWLVPLAWDEYVAEPPEEVKDEAKKLLDGWYFGMLHNVPLDIDSMRDALKYGPIWFCNFNHAMLIYAIDDRIRIFDTYSGGKKSENLDYVQHIYAAYIAPMTPKDASHPKPMNYPEDSLIVVTDGHGELYMNVDNTRLYKDDAGKLLAVLMARNSKNGIASLFPVVHVRTADIADVPKVNLKNETIQ